MAADDLFPVSQVSSSEPPGIGRGARLSPLT